MSMFDDFDAMLNQNSLDMMLCLSDPVQEHEDLLGESFTHPEEKPNCATYGWIWNDEEPVQENKTQSSEEITVDEMKYARIQQEEKVKRFIANIEPINTIMRKVSLQVSTEAGSPKKKKIRKMLSYK